MSRSIRRLNSSLRALTRSNVAFQPSCTPASRRCMQVAVNPQKRPEFRAAQRQTQSYARQKDDEGAAVLEEDDFDSRGMSAVGEEGQEQTRASSSRQPDPQFAEHLDGLFSPLKFPPELARRILTHGSHPAAVHGHNAGLSFMGRRVLESYLLLFLDSTSKLKATHDLESIASRALNTYVLGEHVGPKWGLGRAMRWTPTLSAAQLKATDHAPTLLKNVGLYKVQGDAVAAVMGGIFYQFGGSVAHRVFHTRLLPHLVQGVNGNILPEPFHEDVVAAAERMGGVEGPLIIDSTSSEKLRATSS